MGSVPPSDKDVERALSEGDDHTCHPRPAVAEDLEIGQPERGPSTAVETGHVDEEPGLALDVGDDEVFET